MRILFALPLLSALGLCLSAQTAPAPAAATPAPPAPGTVKWRGALWASGAASDQNTPDGSLFLRPMDAGDGSLALDGLQLGADVTLTDGWTMKFTLLAGQDAKVLNATSQESGDVAFPEAMLVWTGEKDTLTIGRMYTPMGMEVMDQSQNATASRGLLFSFAVPFGQVGLDWHHAFSPVWSTDVYLYNGEDRISDNNKSKTAGLSLTYNHGGAADKFVTLMAFSGAEQNALLADGSANPGAEGRKRNRLSMAGQWVWGASTLKWEGEYATEPFPASTVFAAQGPGNVKASWSGFGLIYKYQFNEGWAAFARAETLSDNTGVRLNADPTVAAIYVPSLNVDLRATSLALGVERHWHATFSRLEVRNDHLNKSVLEAKSDGATPFNAATSLTLTLGTSF